ncbi:MULTISPECIES: CoA transferase [unclassified Microbacterium]|uniref:CaiB/BaiF CoA transferase family protein n=1 Tax=unclassified Microbacterium TaxID=2609290 RepID=UPI00214BC77A|nr:MULTISPECIES: CoA transferase [unclassified Microbacterium]MCR2783413.1 CoA transferase [Microbacterium sp. zg.B96]MDL5351801.1 CoA transferase [Microbacterium sp. zg-YB36]WIM15718.1 CoA transferase [Microbacterium sp. zg-B96]
MASGHGDHRTTEGGPLAGVTIVDTTSMLMGPYCTAVLREMGARIIKIEPREGDISRGIDDREQNLLGPIYLNLNRGKESIALDLRNADDRALFDRFVARADVVTHNRPPGSEIRIGLDYDTLSAVNPRIIVCGMFGFGADGPYGPLPAYDDVIQSASGLAAHQTGAGEPQYIRTPLTDKITGIVAAGAIAAALYEREQSGTGQLIEVPMYETMVRFLLVEQQGAQIFDPPRGPAGYARTNSPHRHPYRTADGLIGILASTDAHWASLFRVLGHAELIQDERFVSITRRTANIDALYAWLAAEVAAHPTEQLLEALQGARVPAMRVNAIEDLFDDPHLRATNFFERVEHPVLGPLRQAGAPVHFGRSGTPELFPAPVLGAHADDLRAEFEA